jgi:2-polyprenyl-3-methyl-5-hydroxy-6-metoxy-1,4-benzoquinol methylase
MAFTSFGMVSFTEERIHNRVLDLLKNETKGSILDIGAGTGALSKKLENDGFEVTACDLHGKNFIPEDIPFKAADLNGTFPFENETFDYIVGTEVIEHLENPWHLMRELYRITKPGGVVILSTPNLHNWYVRLFFLVSSKLYGFLSSYEKIGHITPVFVWNLERMAKGKFKFQEVTTSHSLIPLLNIPLPFNGNFFGQCVVVKMKREENQDENNNMKWYG